LLATVSIGLSDVSLSASKVSSATAAFGGVELQVTVLSTV
jgi:hypothetical protein